jgi:hypothetical protein
MALPNSPFAGTNRGAAPQSAKPVSKSQLQVSTVRRVIGNNVHSGYSLPHGAGFLSTHLFHSDGQTVAVHSYLYRGGVRKVAIPVKTQPRRGAAVTAIKLQPQTVQGF